MKKFEFTIIASGLDHEADDFEDRFYEAGCADATIAYARGAILLQFAREAETLGDAVNSAIKNVRSAGAYVDRVEPDYLVSLSEIAARANLTRAAVSLYATGQRDEGFPHPIARVTTESPLWDWLPVARWLYQRHKISETEVNDASVFRAANDSLEEERKRAQCFA